MVAGLCGAMMATCSDGQTRIRKKQATPIHLTDDTCMENGWNEWRESAGTVNKMDCTCLILSTR